MLARFLCSWFLLLPILSPSGEAANPAGPPDVRIEMVENDQDGQAVKRCGVEEELAAEGTKAWCLFYGEAEPHREGGWEGIRSRSGCGNGPCGALSFESLRGSPYLMIDVSARPIRSIDREVRVEALISLQKLAGFTSEGKPMYEGSRESRVFTAGEIGDLAMPVLIADAVEKEAFGAHEVFLRWRVRDSTRSSSLAYGKIQVSSDIPRADVLLDGRTAGRTSERSPTMLENVPEGSHELSVRDLSGRQMRKMVRVEKDRTAEVTLNLLSAPRSVTREGLVPLGKNPQGHEEFWRTKDEALVVRIPGGPFRMGSPEGEGEPAEHPIHEAHLTEFLIDKAEVTWGQFLKFSQQMGTPLPNAPLWGTPEDYPVGGVTWDEAQGFCQWVGGRLPTEAEWEKAARGTDSRRYPWGEEWDENRCNTRDGGPHRPMGVGVFSECVSPYGLLDMAGSVWEWCEDWYDERYYEISPLRDPRGPSAGTTRVTRGGSWLNASTWTRTAFRQGTSPTWRDVRHGFRCVQSAPGGSPTAATPVIKTASAIAASSSRTLVIDVETVSNPTDRQAPDRCAVSRQVDSGGKQTWWSIFGEARLLENGRWMIVGAKPRCGSGALDETGEVREGSGPFPLLILELATVAVSRPGPLAEATVTLAAREFSGLTEDGKPVYASSSVIRILKLEESGEANLPVLVPTAAERQALGIHEVLVGMRIRPVRPLGAGYGELSVATDIPGAAVLLDGGVVGRTNEHGKLMLRNIPPGERELRVRDHSGREARRMVDVIRDRTVVVALRLPQARPLLPSGVLIPLGDNDWGYLEYRRERDEAVMVRVPEGEFLMGNLETEGCPLPHKVHLSEFAIDKTPVTWGQYERFCQETARPMAPEPYWGIHADHPVVFVAWEEARAYCEWVGARLPTEAEREKAARGTDDRKYPWGNEEPSPERAVFRRNWGYVATDPAGAHPAGASPYGILDMGGNVWEWCEDWYDAAYYQTSPARDPRGPRSGRAHVVRGGSWDSRPSVLSCSCRNWGYLGYREGDFGFRCAADPLR